MLNLEIGQILTQIVAFLIVFWLLKRWTWKPLLGLMHERQQRIESTFLSLEEKKSAMEHQVSAYNKKLEAIDAEATRRMQQVIEEGKLIAQGIQQEANARTEKMLKKAREEIETEIANGRLALKNDVVNLAMLAAQKILQSSISKESQEKLVDEFVNEADFNEHP